jgi:molecular chaperone DnaK (HSP70)
LHAVEEAKKRLSFEPHARLREEHLAERNGVPVHLDMEVARSEYEQLIRPLLDGTLDSVHRALSDAGKRPDQVDDILLVGGVTRTPLITALLQDTTGLTPRQELHPDLCVAFGAGVLAARLAGHAVERVLVDVSPYSFGPSYFGLLNGVPSEHCYRPIIHRNTPLPVSRTESYFTMVDEQQAWQVSIYQGDDPNALNNLLVGRFLAEGFSRVPAGNEILCRMDLDLDGILRVTATEKRTGLAKQITIEGATTAMSESEMAQARLRMQELFGAEDEEVDFNEEFDEEADAEVIDIEARDLSPGASAAEADRDRRVQISEARALLERSRRLLDKMTPEDREEAIALHEQIEEALKTAQWQSLHAAMTTLADLLFYVEEG